MKTIFACIVLVLTSLGLNAQRPEFFKEELEFGIDSVWFSVKGDYYFRNPSHTGIKPVIIFPVARVAGYKSIDTIFVLDTSDPAHQLVVTVQDTTAAFVIDLPAFSEKRIMIYYRQHHNGNEAKYILLSTKTWGKPLEKAVYHLLAEKKYQFSHFSLTPDNILDFDNVTIYSWERTNFMPDIDFVFRF